MEINKVLRLIRRQLGFPNKANWGYAYMLASIGLLATYWVSYIIENAKTSYSATSLIGYSIIGSILALLAFIIPSVILIMRHNGNANNSEFPISLGRFSGIGPLFLSFLSGVGVRFVYSALHNLTSWAWLRMGNNMVFPMFQCINDMKSAPETILYVISTTIIPGIGICLFFLGLIYSLIDKSERKLAYILIPILAALCSMNFIDMLPVFFAMCWLVFLREKTNNILCPLLCLVACTITSILSRGLVPSVDITMVLTYSDIPESYLYSSVAACLVGIIMLAFFYKGFVEFNKSFFAVKPTISDEAPTTNDTNGSDNKSSKKNKAPSFSSGVNLALIVAVIILIVLWNITLKGA